MPRISKEKVATRYWFESGKADGCSKSSDHLPTNWTGVSLAMEFELLALSCWHRGG